MTTYSSMVWVHRSESVLTSGSKSERFSLRTSDLRSVNSPGEPVWKRRNWSRLPEVPRRVTSLRLGLQEHIQRMYRLHRRGRRLSLREFDRHGLVLLWPTALVIKTTTIVTTSYRGCHEKSRWATPESARIAVAGSWWTARSARLRRAPPSSVAPNTKRLVSIDSHCP